jgi:PAS domain S-box-containing protein
MIRVQVGDDDVRIVESLRQTLVDHDYAVETERESDSTTLIAQLRIDTSSLVEQGLNATAARATEERYRILFDYAPDGIVIADPASYYLEVNPSMCQMLGYTREEFIGLHATDIVAPLEIPNIEPALRTIKSNAAYNRQWLFKRKNGTTFPAEVMVTHLPDGNLLAMIRDITEQAAAVSRIRDLNRTYAVLSDINQLVVREQESDKIIERACRIAVEKGNFLLAWIGLTDQGTGRLELRAHAGATPDTLEILRDLLIDPKLGCAVTARALNLGERSVCNDVASDPQAESWREQALQRGYRAMASFPLRIDDGCHGTFNLYADRSGFFDDDEVRLLSELADDISFALTTANRDAERRALTLQLVQAQKIQAIGTLASGIAHDFNNIVGAISGNADLAKLDLPESHPAAVCVDEIQRASQRAKQLVQRILTFSRPQERSLHVMHLPPVVEEAIRLLRSTLPAGVDLRFKCLGLLPTVKADESQIHQVVLNLVTNAWHALEGKNGHIEVDLAECRVDEPLSDIYRDLKPGAYVRLSVKDDGIGMDNEVLDRIFEPFFTTKQPGQGTGLGLSVVHGIVRGHGGAIVVESNVGHGSTFHVYLPECTDATTAATHGKQAHSETLPGHGEKILYIDDEEALVFLTVRFLERMGYRVEGYTLPAEGLKAFREAPQTFDLVITDNNMPWMSGLDVGAEILRIRPDTPVVLVSGYLQSKDREQAAALGIRHILLKPNSVADFGPTVQKLLAESRTKK